VCAHVRDAEPEWRLHRLRRIDGRRGVH
jgi:hypothetical protein